MVQFVFLKFCKSFGRIILVRSCGLKKATIIVAFDFMKHQLKIIALKVKFFGLSRKTKNNSDQLHWPLISVNVLLFRLINFFSRCGVMQMIAVNSEFDYEIYEKTLPAKVSATRKNFYNTWKRVCIEAYLVEDTFHLQYSLEGILDLEKKYFAISVRSSRGNYLERVLEIIIRSDSVRQITSKRGTHR